MTRKRRIVRNLRIDFITGEDAVYRGHQLVPAEFADRIKALANALAGADRKMTYREAE